MNEETNTAECGHPADFALDGVIQPNCYNCSKVTEFPKSPLKLAVLRAAIAAAHTSQKVVGINPNGAAELLDSAVSALYALSEKTGVWL
jgi:hypothetical protein